MDSCSSSALSNISKFTQKEAPVVPVLSSILKSKNPDFVDGFLQQQVAVSSNSDLQKHLSVHSPAHDWSNQFLSSDNFNNSWANEFSNQKLKSSEWTNEISNLQLQSSEWTDEFNQIQGSQSININTESNEQALRESASLLSSILKNSRNKKLQNSKLASFVADLSKDKKLDWSSEFNQKVENKQSSSWSSEFNSSTVYSNNNNLKADVDWSAEFNSSQQDVESRLDSLKNIENDWTSEFETRLQNTTPKDWSTEFQSSELSAKLEKSSLDDSTIYKFSLNNPYLSLNYQSLLTLASSESLQTSIWAIEAQLQQSITSSDLLHEGAFKPDQAALWYELGIKQQENENEDFAIPALLKSVYSSSRYNKAWLALASSYANESRGEGVVSSLFKFLMNNPKYSHLLNTAVRPDSTQLLEKYIQAARFDVNNIDVDIQIGLGVLFNVVGDYAKSIDCFSTVVNIQPNDYASLNKLGATFANSKRHSEAVSCYKRALALKNCYGRARYNLGLSLVALGEYDKAVRELVLACVEGGDACWRMLRQVVYGYHNDLAGVLDEAMAKRDIVFLKKYFNL